MRLGISSYAFTWAIGVPGYAVAQPMTAFELLQKAVELDVQCLQIADNLPLHELHFSAREALCKQAKAAQVTIEVGTRGLQLANIETYLDIAEQFASPLLRVVIDSQNFTPDLSEIIHLLQQIKPHLQQRNIYLAIENHDRFTAQEFLHMLQAVSSPFIGICLDSVNSLGAGEDITRVTEILAPFTINWHVKEFTIFRLPHKMGFCVEGRPVGDGMLPLAWMLGKIPQTCTSAILEQWVPPEQDMMQTIRKEEMWARQSIAYLKNIMKQELN